MKQNLFVIFVAVGMALLVVLFTNFLLLAREENTHSRTIMATILPQRFIIVDQNLTIEKILSNTVEEIRPTVLLGTADGEEIPYSDSIVKQYGDLKPTLNFSSPGVIYEREPRPVMAFLKNVLRGLRW